MLRWMLWTLKVHEKIGPLGYKGILGFYVFCVTIIYGHLQHWIFYSLLGHLLKWVNDCEMWNSSLIVPLRGGEGWK